MVRCNVTTFGKGGAALLGSAGLLVLGSVAQAQNVQKATLPPAVSQQLQQVAQAGIPAGTTSYAELLAMNAAKKQDNTVDIGGRDYPFAIRLGASLSPRVKFVGGADLTVHQLGIGPHWVGRFDAEAIVSANFGGNSTVIPLTFDEVYWSPKTYGSARPYAGIGFGPYFADTTRFGGKIFVGARFSRAISGEASLHFTGYGDPLFVLQVRTSL